MQRHDKSQHHWTRVFLRTTRNITALIDMPEICKNVKKRIEKYWSTSFFWCESGFLTLK
jgi:hypothetical protein